jgi:hypothetical protein
MPCYKPDDKIKKYIKWNEYCLFIQLICNLKNKLHKSVQILSPLQAHNISFVQFTLLLYGFFYFKYNYEL